MSKGYYSDSEVMGSGSDRNTEGPTGGSKGETQWDTLTAFPGVPVRMGKPSEHPGCDDLEVTGQSAVLISVPLLEVVSCLCGDRMSCSAVPLRVWVTVCLCLQKHRDTNLLP